MQGPPGPGRLGQGAGLHQPGASGGQDDRPPLRRCRAGPARQGKPTDIGVGVPLSPRDADWRLIPHWARLAEDRGFSTLGFSDRLVYDNCEPLLAMAASAAVTERIRLTIGVLLAPIRTNTALLAKEVASLDRLSSGRLVLGVGLGGRDDDYTSSGLATKGRGRTLDRQIEELRRIWAGEARGYAGAIGPRPMLATGPPLLVGGRTPAAIERTVRFANGWIAGGGGAEAFARTARAVERAWQAAGKPSRPRLVAAETFALGPSAEERLKAQIREFFGMDPKAAEARLAVAVAGCERLAATIDAYRQAGCDELILGPCSADLDQLEQLAAAVG